MNDEFQIDLPESDTTPPPVVTPVAKSSWPARLPFDVAMGESNEKLCELYDITMEVLNGYFLCQPFRREVSLHAKEIQEHGITFKAKARLQAEEYLLDLDAIVHAPDIPPSVRLEAIKSVVRWGGLEPAPLKADPVSSVTNNRIEISWMSPPDHSQSNVIIDLPV